MKSFNRLFAWSATSAMLVLAAGQVGCCAGPVAHGTAPTSARGSAPGVVDEHAFAVVELFTSEGCSSCPPADAVLTRIVERADQQKLPILALAFHVDYWDRLGWKDPLSSAQATQRQHEYATAFASDEVYTPQMFVNGNHGFVGSREKEADGQIENALKEPGKVTLSLKAQSNIKDQCTLNYHVTGAEKGQAINVAVVEKRVVSEVLRGENAGRTLTHSNVVRSFMTRPLGPDFDGNIEIAIPDGLNARNAILAIYIQDTATMKIMAVTTINVP